jgi:hypothetical protein
MRVGTPHYLGVAGAAALIGIVGYSSCGSHAGAPDRSEEIVRGDQDRDGHASGETLGSAPDAATNKSRAPAGGTGASSGARPGEPLAARPPGSPPGTGVGPEIDGGSPATPPVPTVPRSARVELKPGLTPGASVGGLEYRYPSDGRGPCGCETGDVCVRSTTGIGAVVELCLERPTDCAPLRCGCFLPSPCGSKRQACGEGDSAAWILTCGTRRGQP